MYSPKTQALLVVVGATIVLVCCMPQLARCQAGAGPFSGMRPGGGLFEPTLSFIRQNLRLVNSYVALLRSIFVGAYERPLITSTDMPMTVTRGPSAPKVPPMDLPSIGRRA